MPKPVGIDLENKDFRLIDSSKRIRLQNVARLDTHHHMVMAQREFDKMKNLLKGNVPDGFKVLERCCPVCLDEDVKYEVELNLMSAELEEWEYGEEERLLRGLHIICQECEDKINQSQFDIYSLLECGDTMTVGGQHISSYNVRGYIRSTWQDQED